MNQRANIHSTTLRKLCLPLAALAMLAGCSAPASESAPTYRIDYRLTPQPKKLGVDVEITLSQTDRLLRRYDMRAGEIDLQTVSGDGDVRTDDGRVVWDPPPEGGSLRWFVPLQHRRANGGYDAYITDDWALFRAEDAIPVVRTVSLKGATSATHMAFDLPRGWSSLTQYHGENHQYAIDNPEREFDRPTGWMLLGKFGRRNEEIAGVEVIVAGPLGQSIRRMDTLALLQWTLPEVVNVLPDFPRRLAVFSARDPMWRGGLSAPTSFFIHADRPLLSENGTSSLLHEVMHVGLGLRGPDGGDWIVEGLAEYYSLEALRRSGTISAKRYSLALEMLTDWSKGAKNLCLPSSKGPTTALAVLTLVKLDRQIRAESKYNLDDVVRRLVSDDLDLNVARLQDATADLIGNVPSAIQVANLPGCSG